MTPSQYTANVAYRFGGGKLPSWTALADLENAAMRRTLKLYGTQQQAGRGRLAPDNAEAMIRVQRFIAEPQTPRAISDATGYSYDRTLSILHRLRIAGRVECVKPAPNSLWVAK